MKENETFYQEILDNLYDGVYFVDRERRITYWNRGAERISGFPSETMIGKRCSDNLLMHVDEAGTLLCKEGCPLAATIRDGQAHEVEVYMRHADGHRIPVRVRAAPLYRDGVIIGAVETFSDNSVLIETVRHVRLLSEESLHDVLTGIGNRRYFDSMLNAAFTAFLHHGRSFGLMLLDVDNLKPINDGHGHKSGDQLIKVIADTLNSNLRATDTLARWGGDEFAIIAYDLDQDQLNALAEKLRMLVSQSHLWIGEIDHLPSVSIGVSLARLDDTRDSLWQRVDEQLYQSKHGGKNRITFDE